MLKIHCPYCQEDREEIEFHCAGEAFIARPANTEELDDTQWADYLFHRDNHKGWHYEQWVHNAACRKYFIVKRNTATHQIEQSWRFDEAPNPNQST
jgi:sarcosine oxidase subunit delta